MQALKKAVYFMNKELVLNSLAELISEEITKNKGYDFALVVFDNPKKGTKVFYAGNIEAQELIFKLSVVVCNCEPKTL